MVNAPATENAANSPRRRVIILGASNVQLGICDVLAAARAAWGKPLELMAAAGLGRAFTASSTVGLRTLGDIASCGLWEAIAQRPAAETLGLVTDIGNDLVYGVEVDRLVAGLDLCLARLKNVCSELIVTSLPIETIQRIRPLKFFVLRTILFPGSRLDLRTILGRAMLLNQQVVQLAKRYDAHVVKPMAEWYGWDAIHVQKKKRPVAWSKFFFPVCENGKMMDGASLERIAIHKRRLQPQRKKFLSRTIDHPQPTVTLDDGTTISLY